MGVILFLYSAFVQEPFACGSRGEAAKDWVSAPELDTLHAAMCCAEILYTETGRADYICTLRAVVCGCEPRSVTSNKGRRRLRVFENSVTRKAFWA